MSAPMRKRTRLAKRPGVSRRLFLKGLGLGGAGASLLSACGDSGTPVSTSRVSVSQAAASCAAADGASTLNNQMFAHGVATGDPTATSMIFWTRLSNVSQPTPVILEIYRDAGLKQFVNAFCSTATDARDYTVKMDVSGLEPATTYFYVFKANGSQSRVGRTKTAPAGDVSAVRFGVVSCSSLAHGFFNAYSQLAKRQDIDAIIHLGDYIYEYGNGEYGDVRTYEPANEIKTLQDYRTRHGFYKKTDMDLQNLHALFPFVTIWDDHESTNNSHRDGAENHTEGAEGSWPQRKSWAQQAYDEWMPVRLPEAGNPAKIWRRLRYGNMLDLFMLDTRLFDRDADLGIPVNPVDGTARAEDRKLIGKAQMDWLTDGLKTSTATWKVIGNQVVFHQWSVKPGPDGKVPAPLQSLVGPSGLNGDAWDGYVAERKKITAVLRGDNTGKKVNNTVILTGDVHSSWVADITDDPNDPTVYNPVTGDGSLAVEFVGPAVTSPGLPIPQQSVDAFRLLNPHIKYINLQERGYMLVTFTPQAATCDYWYVSTIEQRGGTERLARTVSVAVNTNRIAGAPALSQ